MSERPQLHIIAGPNGAGKSTLYRNELAPRFPNAEFVNADLLAQAAYGKPATTREETETGQRLADERRRELMAARKDLVTESTFSHPSKLDLVKEAKAMGYDVRLYHVNLRSPELAVKRVERRVNEGGHPVPEDKTRERYVRNQPIIREAAKLADRAMVFDNSEFGKPHTRVMELSQGKAVFVSQLTPPWARELYAQELRGYSPERLNRPAASFAVAAKMAKGELGEEARVFIAKSDGGKYSGKILAETDMHVVQQIGDKSAVAHFKAKLSPAPIVGEDYRITYNGGQGNVVPAALGQRKPKDQDATTTPQPGASYTGAIREVTAKAVLQETNGAGAKATVVSHDKSKLYKLGGGLDALLAAGKTVTIAYGTSGLGQVRDGAATQSRGPKR